MLGALASILSASPALVAACELPGDVLPNNITEGFAVRVQNASYPDIHNRMMSLWDSGGGDEHLFLSPAGNASSALTLVDGVLTLNEPLLIRAVINGEYAPEDNTTKMFMTERGDPRAIYDVVYGCDPDTDAVQTELAFKARDTLEGGHICVRFTTGDRHEFRYSPPDNPGKSLKWLKTHPLLRCSLGETTGRAEDSSSLDTRTSVCESDFGSHPCFMKTGNISGGTKDGIPFAVDERESDWILCSSRAVLLKVPKQSK